MRGLAAHGRDETRKHAGLEVQHVGRRQILCDQDQRQLGDCPGQRRTRRRYRAGHALEMAQDAIHHLLEIGLALAQVLVLHLVELA
ncbi:hypothetical protein D3C87_1914510 [compost metagenome]